MWFTAFVFTILSVGLAYAKGTIPTPPTITSFSPASGPIGTSVTITGTKFNATAEQNIMFFGATKATVTAVSIADEAAGVIATSVTVTVPLGATYKPISFLNLGTALTANSAGPFRGTFTGVVIAAKSLDPKVDSPLNENNSYSVGLNDLDWDNKRDLLVANSYIGTISFFIIPLRTDVLVAALLRSRSTLPQVPFLNT